MLNGNAGRIQGPAIILKVMAGDSISIGTKAYYTNLSGSGTNPSITDALTSLAAGLVGVTGGAKGTMGNLNTTTSPLYGALNSFITNKDNTVTGKPRAYLNWILLDNQYQYDSIKSGAIPVGNYPAGTLNTLVPLSGIVARKNGFLYVWVSNETQGWPVYFDNLSVQMFSGPIVEETHYYPFGLTMAGISDKALKGGYAENKYKYNGKELQNKEFSDGTGWEQYDYGARNYDPQIGRWFNIDPLAEGTRRFSPYVYALNNPLRFIDPDGMTPKTCFDAPVVKGVDHKSGHTKISIFDAQHYARGQGLVEVPDGLVNADGSLFNAGDQSQDSDEHQDEENAKDDGKNKSDANTGSEDDSGGDCSGRYSDYDQNAPVESYNCAGLAFRNYQYINLKDFLAFLMANNKPPQQGDIKFYVWTYNVHLELDNGTFIKLLPSDYHVVAGVVGKGGKDPEKVFSKNGGRRVYGPASPLSWIPPAKEQATTSDRRETPYISNGHKVMVLRTEIHMEMYVVPCGIYRF